MNPILNMETEKQKFAQKSLRALYLELPESIAANHHKIIDEAFEEIRSNQFYEKTMTKSEIKRQAKKLERELGKLSDRLDKLMDEAEISAEGLTEKEIQNGKADELNRIAGILRSADEGVMDAMGDMRCI